MTALPNVLLTARQVTVARLLCRGETDKQIAWAFGLEKGTVSAAVTAMCQLLQVANRGEVSCWILQHPMSLQRIGCLPGLHPMNCPCESPFCTALREEAA
jgi:DNA-binding CsgD family transcriptional regulator